jgi:hypothetical protein
VSGDIHVRGEVEVKVPIEVSKKKDAADKKKESRDNLRLVVEICGLAVVIIYAGLTGYQACQTHSLVSTAQNTYDAANRAYIGPNGGTITTILNETDKRPIGMEFKTQVKNFGTAPGEDFLFRWEPRIDGEAITLPSFGSKPYTLFPTETADLDGRVTGPPYLDLASGHKVLQMNIRISYRSNGKVYTYCERQQYDPIHVNFLDLGPRCDDPWGKGPIPGPAQGLTPWRY